MTLAGSKGGFIAPLKDTGLELRKFQDNIRKYAEDLIKVKSIGIYINNTCNLNCKYCYYRTANGNINELSEDSLKTILKQILNTDISLYGFVGKEIFLPAAQKKALDAMKLIASHKKNGKALKIGAVTNGTYLKDAIPKLKKIGLDYLDISIDSYEEAQNDLYRGKGSFKKATESLREAVNERVAEKIVISTTLYKGNLEKAMDVLNFAKMGVKHYAMMPVLGIKEESHTISREELKDFLANKIPAKAEKIDQKIELILDLDSYVIGEDMEFFSEYFKGCTVNIDAINQLILLKKYGNLEMTVRIELPDPCNGVSSLSHDGLFFDKGGCLIMKEGREKMAIGNVSEEDVSELIKKQESKAMKIAQLRSIFDTPATEILNKFEKTNLYTTPKMVK